MRFHWADRTRWKRKYYDLHNILAFYASAIALIVALAGLIMALNWFAEGIYTMTGGEKQATFSLPTNVSQPENSPIEGKPIDVLWQQMMTEYPNASIVEMHYPPGD